MILKKENEGENMFCKNCGRNIPDDSVFCDGCGSPVCANKAPAQGADVPQSFTADGGDYPERSVVIPQENIKGGKKAKKDKKNKKKRPWLRFIIVIFVLFLTFHTAKAVVFFVDYHEYIFVNKEQCGMRDKDELIDKFIEAMLNDDDGECYRLSLLPLGFDKIIEEESDNATWKDRAIIAKTVMVTTSNRGLTITEMLETEIFSSTYTIIETESVDTEKDLDNLYEYDFDFDADDIEKAEQYIIKITCRADNGKVVEMRLSLELIRISRVWYAYTWGVYDLIEKEA